MNRYLILGSLFLFSALNASNTENRPSSLELNALTITAQKEETTLQETPISISVLTATEIEDRNLQSLWQLLMFPVYSCLTLVEQALYSLPCEDLVLILRLAHLQ